MNDLTWLARNVHEWPVGASYIAKHESYDSWCSETAFGANYEQHDDCYGKRYTKAQWLAERERLQNKPKEWEGEWLFQDKHGWWNSFDDSETPMVYGVKDTENYCTSKGFFKTYAQGIVLGDWRDTLEKRPEQMTPPTHTNHRCVQVNIENQEWDREGLPPVWVRIEAIGEHNTEWFELEIVAMRDGNAWIIDYSNGLKRDYIICLDSYKFRPLKTEEEKAVEEMKQYCPYKGSWKSTYEEFARELVRNGYRKP